jgi:hypothetical protein
VGDLGHGGRRRGIISLVMRWTALPLVPRGLAGVGTVQSLTDATFNPCQQAWAWPADVTQGWPLQRWLSRAQRQDLPTF